MASVVRAEDIASWRPVLAGLCATLVGIGLARFAYAPLIPALIAAHWFSPSATVYLGAANLAGYLGGALMALAAPVVLPQIPRSRRGVASGAIFTGVGLGIAASGTLVPLLMHAGLAQTWFGLGAVALLLTVLSWGGWPREQLPATHHQPSVPPSPRSGLVALYVEYGLNAVGLVPHMIFLVDFVARGLGRGLVTGAQYWVLFGVGAMLGPLASGRVADRIGFASTLRCAFVLQAGLVALLVFSASPLSLSISSIVVGAMVPGVVPLVLGRVHELIPRDADQQRKAWGLCTTAFALGQAAAAYGFTYIFAHTGGAYRVLFALGAAALVTALVMDVSMAQFSTRRRRAVCE